jgi:anti-sigma regulatory factor (Ser/Thr protein kinase)
LTSVLIEQTASRTHTYQGQVDQVSRVRRAIADYLPACPAAADAVLIASELATNAIIHSASRGRSFTIRTEVHPDYIRIEVEDHGGPWRSKPPDGRPHGLDVIEALTGPDNWGIDTTTDGHRIVWAQLDLPTKKRA